MTYREMSDVTRIQYLRSEITIPATVYEAAVHLYASYRQSSVGADTDEKALREKAVADAIELALATERICAGTGTISPGLK